MNRKVRVENKTDFMIKLIRIKQLDFSSPQTGSDGHRY